MSDRALSLSLLSVRPSKPVIRLADNGDPVLNSYLGPFQIGTRLALVCEVRGGECIMLDLVWPFKEPTWAY